MSTTRWYNPDRARDLAGPAWPRCEELIRQFEAAWQRGEAPAIEDYLQAEPPERKTLIIELVHVDLEFRLKAGEPARAEEYLDRFPELPLDPRIVIELVDAEFDLRRSRGEAISLTEYQQRFPEHAPALAGGRAAAKETSTGRGITPTAPAVPPAIAGYEIVGEIGRGGMGVIYRARDARLDRHVALKFLPAEYAQDSDHLRRFLHEARAASALNHPNICTVHALGEHEGRPYIVLEFIDGVTLRSWAAGRPGFHEVATVIRQAVRALAAAHAAGVVHRDIKPDNIMLRPDGFVKVVDFGLARRIPTAAGPAADTVLGAVFGTAAYMSPEQARGEPVDGASDVFSLGIVLYQLVTGRHPFEAGSTAGVMHAIVTSEPLPPSAVNPLAPRRLEDLIGSMLHKDRRLRPRAGEVLEALTRFLAEEPAETEAPVVTQVVRREDELARLLEALTRADVGQGSVVCVSGEPGIGKTTLVEDFLAGIQSEAPHCTILRGQCSERLAGTEAYLPVLDALGNLCRADRGGTMARHVKILAPTWHAQLTAPVDATVADVATPPRAMSQQAMLREFWNLLLELSRRGPVVFFIDDVHWADVSTVDLLSRVGSQCRSARVLLVLTYRKTELLIGPHPFHQVRLELIAKGVCQDLRLNFLDREQVCHYLDLLFPEHDLPVEFIDFVVARTEGSPLFMADLLRYLRERGVLAERHGRWTLSGDLPDLHRDLPGSVSGMIERKLDRLDRDSLLLLTAAAVQGHEFDSAAVAEAAGLDATAAEDLLHSLDRVHGLVRQVREHELPDHTLSVRYTFVHALYQQTLFTEAAPTRRASLALALASAVQRHHERDCAAVANELACLFEVGRDFPQAARRFRQAAQHAGRLFAHREAAALARNGLRVLGKLPPSPERDALELSLQTMLGLQLQVTHGFAAPDARTAYTRARELCPNPPTIESYPVLWGLWLYAKVRSVLDIARDLAAELEALALQADAADLVLQSQQALAVTSLCRGEPADTVQRMEKALALYDPARHASHTLLFGQDPAVACLAFGGVALGLLGRHDEARERCRQALTLSHQLLQPSTQVLALHFAAMLYQLCGEPDQARVCAEMSGGISAAHGFNFWEAGATVLRGWATAMLGDHDGGVALLRQGLREWEATGSLTYVPYYLGLLAEVLLKHGDRAEAGATLDKALQLVAHTQERLYLVHLLALQKQLSDEEDSAVRA